MTGYCWLKRRRGATQPASAIHARTELSLQIHLVHAPEFRLSSLRSHSLLHNSQVCHQYVRSGQSLCNRKLNNSSGIWLANSELSESQCRPWATFQVIANVPIILLVSTLLSLRLYHIYDRNRIVSILLACVDQNDALLQLLVVMLACTVAMVAVTVIAHKEFGPPTCKLLVCPS